MGTAEQGRVRDIVQVIAAIALVGLSGYVVKLAVDSRDTPDVLWSVAGAACLTGLVGLAMWWLERRAVRRLAGELGGIDDHRQSEIDELRERAERKQEDLESRLRDREQALDRERELRVRVERARSS